MFGNEIVDAGTIIKQLYRKEKSFRIKFMKIKRATCTFLSELPICIINPQIKSIILLIINISSSAQCPTKP